MRFETFRDSSLVETEDVKSIFVALERISRKIFDELGEGFEEHIYQQALQIEMRELGISFQREVNIEIFYRGYPVGVDRPDFIIRPFRKGDFQLSVPVVVELKSVKKLKDDHFTQAKSYLKSLRYSSDGELKGCKHSFLINFPKDGECGVEVYLIELKEG